MNIEKAKKILSNIKIAKYSCLDMNYQFQIKEVDEVEAHAGFYFIRTSFQRKDINTGELGTGWGRWNTTPVSGATETSIVMTAWVCVEQVVKHELLEGFEYLNKKVFNPHKTIKQLIYPEKF